ncbi:uncharacterized protein LOC119276976 [Triticum dicoccoides]|uniref:uncharacterized protein LOC119276976 n=1 Tax=Triticum dicoccoides TaxID=85692 RepID=UPI000E79EBE2|nr:uncharacterized protein LOC119276976 [Triticum dicoccoides]
MPATHLAILVLVLVYFLVWKMVSYPPNNFSLSLQRPGRSLPPSWAVQHDSAKSFDAPAQEAAADSRAGRQCPCARFKGHGILRPFELGDGPIQHPTCPRTTPSITTRTLVPQQRPGRSPSAP